MNKYTGKKYCDTDAILAWETGNELVPPIGSNWTAMMASFIKGVDARHLVLSGTYGLRLEDLESSVVDMASDHFYPPSTARVALDAGLAAAYKKVLIVGEFGWTYNATGDAAVPFMAEMESLPALAGDLYWSLFPHLDTYGFVQHDDGFTMHYPGDWLFMDTLSLALSQHARLMSGNASLPVGEEIGSPVLHPLKPVRRGSSAMDFVVTWRGVALAVNYTIFVQHPPEDVIYVLVHGVTDDMLPFTVSNDAGTKATCLTVQALSRPGIRGEVSNQECWYP